MTGLKYRVERDSMGNHNAVSVAGCHGQLQLNAFKLVMIFNLLQSIGLLADAIDSLVDRCIVGIEANGNASPNTSNCRSCWSRR